MKSHTQLVSVLIPNWNGATDTIDCLHSLLKQDYGSKNLEIIIVDNGSEDESVRIIRQELTGIGRNFHRCLLIEHKENRGIAVAYNHALEMASEEGFAILRLDNDVVLPHSGVSRLMSKLCSSEQIVIVGCRIVSYDTSPALAHHYGALQIDWWSGKAKLSYPDCDVDCDGIAGCAMLIKKDVVRKLRWFFDPSRFLANELDLCQRVRELGYRVTYTPSVEIFHKGARSSSKRDEFIRFEAIQDSYLFHLKYNKYPALAWYLLNVTSRSLVKWVLGDHVSAKALRAAWVERRERKCRTT